MQEIMSAGVNGSAVKTICEVRLEEERRKSSDKGEIQEEEETISPQRTPVKLQDGVRKKESPCIVCGKERAVKKKRKKRRTCLGFL